MQPLPSALQKLVSELVKLPSIGERTAIRLAYHLVGNDRPLAMSLSKALIDAVEMVQLCKHCFFLSDQETCPICRNAGRDRTLMCVVEKPMDVVAFERVGDFRGVYHVLHGLWAPLKGLGPEEIRLAELMNRVKGGEVREVILATGSTVEGDATALYIARQMEDLGIRASRLAQGVPKGGDLEYLDDVTLSRALAGRNRVGNFGNP